MTLASFLFWALTFASIAALGWMTLAFYHHTPAKCPECQRRARGLRSGDEVAALRERHPSPSSYWATECDEPGCYCHQLH